MGGISGAYNILIVESLKEKDHSEDLGIGWRIKLKQTLGKLVRKKYFGFIWPKIGTSSGQ
jgi:hypothetical protein